MVQQCQAFEGEEGKDFLDRFRLLGNDGRQAASSDDDGGAAKFPFYAPDNAIDQSHIAKQESTLNAPDRILTDDGFGPDDFDFGQFRSAGK